MSTNTDNGSRGSTPWLAFLVGGLLVAVAAMAFFVFTGGKLSAPQKETANIEFNVKPPAPNPVQ